MPGTLTYSPADVIRQLLIDLAYGTSSSGTADWPVYCSTLPDSPDKVITVVDTTGIHQGRLMISGEVEERHGIQILVRSAKFPSGWSKADDITVGLDAVYQAGVVMDTKSYFVHAISRSSGPIALGKEAPSEGSNIPISKREMFSVNCTVSVRETN